MTKKSDVKRGPFTLTATGNQFHFWPLSPESVHIEDIARGLSNICRFNGHLAPGVFYSVAQHSCLVAQIVSIEAIKRFGPFAHGDPKVRNIIRAALLHDAPEAYLGDFAGPAKVGYDPEYIKTDKPHPFLTEGVRLFREYEDLLFATIAKRFDLPEVIPDLVHFVDKRIIFPIEWAMLKAAQLEEGDTGSGVSYIIPPEVKNYSNLEFAPKNPIDAEEEFLELWFSINNPPEEIINDPEDAA